MNPTLSLHETERIPDQAAVRDYDELDGHAMAAFPRIAETGTAVVEDRVADGLTDGEIVRYTVYYRVHLD